LGLCGAVDFPGRSRVQQGPTACGKCVECNGKAIARVIRGSGGVAWMTTVVFWEHRQPGKLWGRLCGLACNRASRCAGGLIPYDPYHSQQMCGITPDPEAQLSPIPPRVRRLFV
jgi:hypothetical protein